MSASYNIFIPFYKMFSTAKKNKNNFIYLPIKKNTHTNKHINKYIYISIYTCNFLKIKKKNSNIIIEHN